MAMALITPPASTPVSVVKVKEHLKVENVDDDQMIGDLIDQATSHIQNLINHKLITQDWRFYFDKLPDERCLQLDLAPVSSVLEVRYFDEQGDIITLAGNDYQLGSHMHPARLWIKKPLNVAQQLNGIEVDLRVGFGVASVDIPGDIMRALMLTISHWYEFRGAVHPSDQPLTTPAGLNRLLSPYKKVRL